MGTCISLCFIPFFRAFTAVFIQPSWEVAIDFIIRLIMQRNIVSCRKTILLNIDDIYQKKS
jgi:hypothetical protein